jgi:hypothetical protein
LKNEFYFQWMNFSTMLRDANFIRPHLISSWCLANYGMHNDNFFRLKMPQIVKCNLTLVGAKMFSPTPKTLPIARKWSDREPINTFICLFSLKNIFQNFKDLIMKYKLNLNEFYSRLWYITNVVALFYCLICMRSNHPKVLFLPLGGKFSIKSWKDGTSALED